MSAVHIKDDITRCSSFEKHTLQFRQIHAISPHFRHGLSAATHDNPDTHTKDTNQRISEESTPDHGTHHHRPHIQTYAMTDSPDTPDTTHPLSSQELEVGLIYAVLTYQGELASWNWAFFILNPSVEPIGTARTMFHVVKTDSAGMWRFEVELRVVLPRLRPGTDLELEPALVISRAMPRFSLGSCSFPIAVKVAASVSSQCQVD
ncbi:unnamed protein product [Cyclocybe aegerita]|uniref:Uncharacterized protein n=1 Tax=Cyclocybe aegerita TaxID=1973307 RepID=A0A8S0Y037_CYCAE|nr:unnamed protein product [Cyclocybe aegerita]